MIPNMQVDVARVTAHFKAEIAELAGDKVMLLARIDMLEDKVLALEVAEEKRVAELERAEEMKCLPAAPREPRRSVPSRSSIQTADGSGQ